MRKPLSMLLFKDLYEHVTLLANKSPNFLAWICPLMNSRVALPNENIYSENDEIFEIFFLKQGSCNYVLRRFNNTPYIHIVQHTCFGLVDYVAGMLAKSGPIGAKNIMSVFEAYSSDDMTVFDNLRRKFTVQASEEECYPEFLLLNNHDLGEMRSDFKNEFVEFFESALEELEKTIDVRLHAFDLCQQILKQSGTGQPQYNIKVLTTEELNEKTREEVLNFCKTSMDE